MSILCFGIKRLFIILWRKLRPTRYSRRADDTARYFSYGKYAKKRNFNQDYPLINLSKVDHKVFPHLPFPKAVGDAVRICVKSHKSDGYPPIGGYEHSRKAVAHFCSSGNASYNARDVILTHGSEGALEILFSALANKGQTILIPKPGHAYYKYFGKELGIVAKTYKLLPGQNWEIDFDYLGQCVSHSDTVALLVANPSPVCGSIFSKEHLLDILDFARERRIPIIADEMISDLVYDKPFFPIDSLSNGVPVFSIKGLAANCLVTGWKCSWITIHNGVANLKEIREALHKLSALHAVPCSFVQAALPKILKTVPKLHFENIVAQLEKNAKFIYTEIDRIPGLVPQKTHAGICAQVGIDMRYFVMFRNHEKVADQLMKEVSLIISPGGIQKNSFRNCFQIPLTYPKSVLQEICERLERFSLECSKKYMLDWSMGTRSAIEMFRR